MDDLKKIITPFDFLLKRAEGLEQDGQRKLNEAKESRDHAERSESRGMELLAEAAHNRRDAEFLQKFRGIPPSEKQTNGAAEGVDKAEEANVAVVSSTVSNSNVVTELRAGIAELSSRLTLLEREQVVTINIG